MFIVFLRFSAHRDRAPEHLDAHRAWIRQGVEDGVFLVVGSLAQQGGGAIVAHGILREELEARVAADPFVVEGVVTAEIHELEPSITDARLDFVRA